MFEKVVLFVLDFHLASIFSVSLSNSPKGLRVNSRFSPVM